MIGWHGLWKELVSNSADIPRLTVLYQRCLSFADSWLDRSLQALPALLLYTSSSSTHISLSFSECRSKRVQPYNCTIQLLSAEVKQMSAPGFNLEDNSCSGLMKYAGIDHICSISSITTADPHGIRKKLSQILTKLKGPCLMIILHAPCSSVIFDLILSYNTFYQGCPILQFW